MSPALIIAFFSALFAGAIGWGAAAHVYGAKITEIRLEAANERIAIQRSHRQTLERVASQISQAQADAAVRNDVIRRDAGRAADVAGGLRITSTAAVRAASDNDDACRAIVGAYDQLFAEGSGLLREVATVADQCISDNQALIEGWPK